MKNYDLIQARNGTIPQFEGQDGQPKAVTGDHGPYYQLVDVNGNPLFSENNPAHVQLTGRNVEVDYIYEREVRNESTRLEDRFVPNGAIGLIFVCQIYGTTGTFSSNQGLSITVYQSSLDQDVALWRLDTEATQTSRRPQMIYTYPAINNGEVSMYEGADGKIAPMPVHSRMRFRIEISGEFDTDEGFDCDAYALWLF